MTNYKNSSLYGNDNSVFTRKYISDSGLDRGMRYYHIEGSKLSFSVSIDRALDIATLRYNGVNIPYISPTGFADPRRMMYSEYMSKHAFCGGMLMTCGLENIGTECTTDEGYFPQHGTLSLMPASNEQICKTVVNDDIIVEISGDIDCYQLNDYSFTLHRKISFNNTSSSIKITDEVTNNYNCATPIFIMYHFNFGYPFLDEDCKLSIPSLSRTPKNEISLPYLDKYLLLTPPADNSPSHAIYHKFADSGINEVSIRNEKLNIMAKIAFNGETLGCLNQWKMLLENEYCLSLEPCNTFPFGRAKILENGSAKYLGAGESIKYETELKFSQI